MNTPSADEINRHASVFMKRGIALLDKNNPAYLEDAVGCFDSAIALRRDLPLDANPQFPYGLAAGWINRGDALARLGSATDLAEAVRSYDAALGLLRGVPLDADPLYRRRLAIAWQNRGLALQAQNNEPARRQAKRSFAAAMAALLEGNAAEIPDRDYLLAAVRMNDAHGLVREKTIESILEARTAAQEAVALADRTSKRDFAMAEVSLKARHILCVAFAALLHDIDHATFSKQELIGDATDAAEEGLALARAWEERGIKTFRPIAQDLFGFAARVYQIFQPHFFNEFLLEHLNPWPESPESSAQWKRRLT